MRRDDFMAIWKVLDSAFPGDRDPATLETYAGQLASTSPDLFAAAVDWCIGNDEWFPTVARLRESSRLAAKSSQFRGDQPLPAAPIGNTNERVRGGRFGLLMSKAALAGFGCEWVERDHFEVVCRPRRDELTIRFDPGADEILISGVPVTFDEVALMVRGEELNLSGTATGGHNHRGAGNCGVCADSTVRWGR